MLHVGDKHWIDDLTLRFRLAKMTRVHFWGPTCEVVSVSEIERETTRRSIVEITTRLVSTRSSQQ